MALVTRSGKGSLLTHSEMDGNLTYLRDLGRNDFIYSRLNPLSSELLTINAHGPTASNNGYEQDKVWMTIDGIDMSVRSSPFLIMDNGVHILLGYPSGGAKARESNPYLLAMTLDEKNNYVYKSKYLIDSENYSRYSWNWTYKNPSVKNQIKLVTYTDWSEWSSRNVGSYVVTITYNSDTSISVSENVFNVGSNFDTLFNNETGQLDINYSSVVAEPWWNSNDDWCGMMYGEKAGWVWYKRSSPVNQKYLGYNVLTGSYQVVDLKTGLAYGTGLQNLSNIKYLDSKGFELILNSIKVYSHAKYGIIATFRGDDSEKGGVTPTRIWSPYYTNVDKATVITARNYSNASILFTDGNSSLNEWNSTWVSTLSNNYFYYFTSNAISERAALAEVAFEAQSTSYFYYMVRVKLDSTTTQSDDDVAEFDKIYINDDSVYNGWGRFSFWFKEESIIFTGVSDRIISGGAMYDHVVVWKDNEVSKKLSASTYPHYITSDAIYTYYLLSCAMFASNLKLTYVDNTF